MIIVHVHAVSKNHDANIEISHAAKEILDKKSLLGSVNTNSEKTNIVEDAVRKINPPERAYPSMRGIWESTLEEVQTQDGSQIYVTKIEWEAPVGFEFEDFRDKIPSHSEVVLQSYTRKYQHQDGEDPPFSYDPSQDYYTEPDR
jgi:hypothetical protein